MIELNRDLRITPTNLHWLENMPPEEDLCAHGGVSIWYREALIFDDSNANWTLSASAIYLLRSLTQDHNENSRISGFLFPCCGHSMYFVPGSEILAFTECCNGRDFDIVHDGQFVRLIFNEIDQLVVPILVWRTAVINFAIEIKDFYFNSAVKKPIDKDDAPAYAAFRNELQGITLE